MKTSCIFHQPNQKIVLIKEDFVKLCEGNTTAACLLSIFEYWTNIKLENKKQVSIENKFRVKGGFEPKTENTWIYKTPLQLSKDSLGLLKLYDIRKNLKYLFEKGYLKRRNNPLYKWDRTFQYQLQVEKINACIRCPQQIIESLAINQASASGKTIPEVTSEVTSEVIYSPGGENVKSSPPSLSNKSLLEKKETFNPELEIQKLCDCPQAHVSLIGKLFKWHAEEFGFKFDSCKEFQAMFRRNLRDALILASLGYEDEFYIHLLGFSAKQLRKMNGDERVPFFHLATALKFKDDFKIQYLDYKKLSEMPATNEQSTDRPKTN